MTSIDKVPPSIYTRSCPNCGGNISSQRLFNGSVCESCLKEDKEFNNLSDLINILSENNTLKNLNQLYNILEEYKKVEEIFSKLLNSSKPIGPQRSWIIRFLRGESFAIIAPPGLGKTTFGLIMSLYNATRNRKSIIIFPTRTLISQTIDKLAKFSESYSYSPRILYNKQSSTQTENVLEQLKSGDFDIFVSTSRYVIQNLSELSNVKFDFIFVDDVDAALKSGKSAKAILRLVGFTDEDIQTTMKLLRENIGDEEKFGKIQEIRENKLKDKIVIFSSATISRGNPTLSSLMGFRPGSSVIYLRNIYDSYIDLTQTCKGQDVDECTLGTVIRLLKRLNDGTLIFVPIDKGVQYAEYLASNLRDHGINAESVASSSISRLEKFERGEVGSLVGVATHYGVLVRGIDLPWRVKYSIFVGIPKFKFKIGEYMHPLALTRLLSLVYLVKNDDKIRGLLSYIRKRLRRISPAALAMLAKDIREGKIDDERLKEAYSLVNEYLKDTEFLKKISDVGDLVIEGDYILMPDYLTYIQASGRTSRLYGANLTTGLSVLLIDNLRLFELLNKKLNLILDEVKWYPLDIDADRLGQASLSDIVTKITEERENLSKMKKEGSVESSALNVKTTLFIVESPNKAKTISNFFSRPSTRSYGKLRVYETVLGDRILIVAASGGHIYDLITEDDNERYDGNYVYGVLVKDSNFVPIYSTIKKCEKGHQIVKDLSENKCPICGSKIVADKTEVVDILRKLALEADEVLIGTDPDTEGEKIAWDIYLAIRPFNSNIKRAEFHEVTRRAILNAIKNPREFNDNLVKSQIVRRIEDRWIGFKLSRKLQTEFWEQHCKSISKENTECKENRNLSAGRVQTPVLDWVVNRYQKYNENKKKYLIIESQDKSVFPFSILASKKNGLSKKTQIFIQIVDINTKEEDFGPLPPYTTDTLLSDAANLLRIPASETMRIAQDLFELGLITYHRTDSTRISNVGISVAESYLKSKQVDISKVFRPRSWGEGGAHEAIRPTKPLDETMLKASIEQGDLELSKQLTFNHFRVYNLIFRRFITSQLPPLIVTKQIVKIRAYTDDNTELDLDEGKKEFVIGYRLKEGDEFRQVLQEAIYTTFKPYQPIEEKMKGKELIGKVTGTLNKSDVQLYTEGELISEMKSKQIGRPSTYAVIISTLKKRRYIIESKNLKKIIPTKLGMAVKEYLMENYKQIVSEKRTVKLLEKMNEVEEGKVDYLVLLKELYNEIQTIS
ncbi:DNA reverse gyrase [Saccharolobus shibatae B12]|uniref:Reverse gyrase n=2 Tax=Saccharolobus TaxID=2100760 RepID=A0A8F5BRG9_SACSH|nr:reverse gyrase [Saccharolobus shibatae]QXJ30126.1 DNA reverse gyrase [Saccharolobus shibatae B12]